MSIIKTAGKVVKWTLIGSGSLFALFVGIGLMGGWDKPVEAQKVPEVVQATPTPSPAPQPVETAQKAENSVVCPETKQDWKVAVKLNQFKLRDEIKNYDKMTDIQKDKMFERAKGKTIVIGTWLSEVEKVSDGYRLSLDVDDNTGKYAMTLPEITTIAYHQEDDDMITSLSKGHKIIILGTITDAQGVLMHPTFDVDVRCFGIDG